MFTRGVVRLGVLVLGCAALVVALGGCPPRPHTNAPTVSSTHPKDGATGVRVNRKLAATFSEAMDPSTITEATFTLDAGKTPVSGTVDYADVTATFTPADDLAPDTTYTAAVWMEVTDAAGNEMESDYEWTFTTGSNLDTRAPTVRSTDPADDAIGVPVNKEIEATFSEAMDPVTISTATFTLDAGKTPVSGTVVCAGRKATFTPAGGLAPNTTYTAIVWMEATDLAGNALASDHVWTFTTGVTTAQEPVDLGSANTFAILAGSTVTNTGPSIVTGDLGVSPGTGVVGFPPGILNGAIFTGVASAAGQAKVDLTTAFNDAAGRSVGSVSLPGDLGGLNPVPRSLHKLDLGHAVVRECHARRPGRLQCGLSLPDGLHAHHGVRHPGCPERRRQGCQHLLASWQFGDARNEFHLQGKYTGARINHVDDRRNAERPSVDTDRRGYIRRLRHHSAWLVRQDEFSSEVGERSTSSGPFRSRSGCRGVCRSAESLSYGL